MAITIKRAYDKAEPSDGYRVLVDRLWPRGIKKEELALNEWCKDVAPSTELREWFAHDPAKFEEFKVRYMEELAGSNAPQQLLARADRQSMTLVYAAKDERNNQAVVLQAYLQKLVES